MKLITSAHNEQLKHLARLLSQSKARRQHGQTVLEGVHLLQAYLQAGGLPQQVYIPEAKAENAEIRTLADTLPPEVLTLVAGEALAKITSLTDADEIMTLIAVPQASALPEGGDCVVLDRVQDPGNVGTVIRSTAASGIRRMVLGNGCADVWSPKVLRAAMGAHFLLEICVQADLQPWLAAYPDKVWATALGGGHPAGLYDLDLRQPAAWVFGNEGSGVDDGILAAVSASVRIPMQGQTESLNVAMAATVCLFEQMRQRHHNSAGAAV